MSDVLTPQERQITELIKTVFEDGGVLFVMKAGGSHVAIKSDGEEGRLMLLVSSNAYRDKEKEIVMQKALEHYVASSWKEDEFIGSNPLLVWHDGDPIGDIIYAEMEGPFLVEVARERPDAVVNLAGENDPPVEISIKKVWDALEKEEGLGASIHFLFPKKDKQDGDYKRIIKLETSVLPRKNAANTFTGVEILGDKDD
jgi:hypothetical protein